MNKKSFGPCAFLLMALVVPAAHAEDESKVLRATELVGSGETAEVFSLLSEAAEAGPLSVSWQETEALALYKSKNYEEAVDAFMALGKLSPATLEMHTAELADCYMLSGQTFLAEPLFQKIQLTADVNRFRGLVNSLLMGKAAELELALAKMEDGLPKEFLRAAMQYLQDKKDEGKAIVLAAMKDRPEAVLKPYLQTMREFGWAKDLDAAPVPATASTAVPIPVITP